MNNRITMVSVQFLTISSTKSSRRNTPSHPASVKDEAVYLILERLIFTEKGSESLLLHVLNHVQDYVWNI